MKLTRFVAPALFLIYEMSMPAGAAMNDPGPMGSTAEGAPTPDAELRSKMQQPAPLTPRPLPPSPIKKIKKWSADRKAKSHALWLQIQAISSRIDESQRLGRLDPNAANERRKQLSALQKKYGIKGKADDLSLSSKNRRQLKMDLDALENKVP